MPQTNLLFLIFAKTDLFLDKRELKNSSLVHCNRLPSYPTANDVSPLPPPPLLCLCLDTECAAECVAPVRAVRATLPGHALFFTKLSNLFEEKDTHAHKCHSQAVVSAISVAGFGVIYVIFPTTRAQCEHTLIALSNLC